MRLSSFVVNGKEHVEGQIDYGRLAAMRGLLWTVSTFAWLPVVLPFLGHVLEGGVRSSWAATLDRAVVVGAMLAWMRFGSSFLTCDHDTSLMGMVGGAKARRLQEDARRASSGIALVVAGASSLRVTALLGVGMVGSLALGVGVGIVASLVGRTVRVLKGADGAEESADVALGRLCWRYAWYAAACAILSAVSTHIALQAQGEAISGLAGEQIVRTSYLSLKCAGAVLVGMIAYSSILRSLRRVATARAVLVFLSGYLLGAGAGVLVGCYVGMATSVATQVALYLVNNAGRHDGRATPQKAATVARWGGIFLGVYAFLTWLYFGGGWSALRTLP